MSAFLANPVEYDITIGVNRAAQAYPCDVWAFGDVVAFQKFTPLGRPLLLTNADAVKKLANDERLPGYVVRTIESLGVETPKPLTETTYTMITALAYAIAESATHVAIHGCDWRGRDNWDGSEPIGPNRCPRRWNREADEVRRMLPLLAERGIKITGLPEAAEPELVQ